MKLRDYQVVCADAIFDQWNKGSKSTMLVVFTGGGKTVIFAEVIRRMQPKRALVIAHREELIWQARERIESTTGLACEVEMADLVASTNLFHRTPVVISTVQTQTSKNGERKRYHRFKPEEFGLVILDECFVAGTSVSGRPIESLKMGDRVETHMGTGIVNWCFKRPAHTICRLTFSDGRQIVCTPNHPIWDASTGQFVEAILLTKKSMVLTIMPYEQVCHLQRTNKKQALQKARVSLRAQSGHNPKNVSEAWRGDYALPKNKRYEQARSQSKAGRHASGDGVEAASARRERNGSNDSPTSLSGGAWMGDGGSNTNASKAKEGVRLSDLLQGGCWKPDLKNSNRGRWKLTQFIGASSTRPKERRLAAFVRLARVEVCKRGSSREFARLCPDGFVYNVSVSNGNTYFANGVLVHNCHHGTADSYRELINYYCTNPELKVLGVTATPDRADEEALGQIMQSVAANYTILDGIRDGWLCDITQQFVPVAGLDYTHIRTTAGDLNGGDLSRVMEAESNIAGVCHPSIEVMFGLEPHTLDKIEVPKWAEYIAGLGKDARRTIIFTCSVAQAEACCNIFNRVMPGKAEWVCGKTRKDERQAILARFKNGTTRVVCNCGVLTEGYDNPLVEVIVMARPTKSRSLYAQMVGRATRPIPGLVDGVETKEARRAKIAVSEKPYCRIVDFVGNAGRHKLMTCADILGGKVSERARERAVEKAIEDGKPRRMMLTLDKAEQELIEEERLQREERRRQEEARKAALVARANFKMQNIDPFNKADRLPVKLSSCSADGRTFSQKQVGLLRKAGIDPSKMSYRQGQAIIGKIMATPSDGQRKVLVKFGMDPKKFDRKSASKMIDSIAANGWRRPVMEEVDAT